MTIIKQSDELKDLLAFERQRGRKIGFVPTMGALHPGHISLTTTARSESDFTVCSIFINPTQFNDLADFRKYPVTLDKDIQLLEGGQVDLLFIPSVDEIYGSRQSELEKYDLGYLEKILEGQYRPGHFQGVCQVMARLLAIVQPDILIMGQKDYQQCMVVKKLIELKGWNGKIDLQLGPTVREPDGLAMSSRNLRLSQSARSMAPAIYQALDHAKKYLAKEELNRLEAESAEMLTTNGFKVDYFEIATAADLELIEEWDGKTRLVALVAAYLDNVRLIDNLILN